MKQNTLILGSEASEEKDKKEPDISEKILKTRTILLSGEVNKKLA